MSGVIHCAIQSIARCVYDEFYFHHLSDKQVISMKDRLSDLHQAYELEKSGIHYYIFDTCSSYLCVICELCMYPLHVSEHKSMTLLQVLTRTQTG